MDDNDLEKYLRDISTRTARIDERTLYIEQDVAALKEKDSAQDESIESLNRQVHRNSIAVNSALFGASAAVTAVFGKLAGLLKF